MNKDGKKIAQYEDFKFLETVAMQPHMFILHPFDDAGSAQITNQLSHALRAVKLQ